jgi:bile-acid 7alpha-dehydratase
MKELKKMVQALEDIEAIKRLKGKYIRCVDRKLWRELEECFNEDAEAHYEEKTYYIGREAIIGFLKSSLKEGIITSSHECHTPEIALNGDGTARGIWKFHDYIVTKQKQVMTSWAYYADKPVKVNSEAKIRVVSYTRDFQESIKQ